MAQTSYPDVIIFTIPGDFHASAVNWALKRLGVSSEIVILGDLPDYGKYSINIDRYGLDVVFLDRREVEIHSSNAKVIWNRRVGYPPAPDHVHDCDKEIVRRTCLEHINNIRAALSHQAVFINDPSAQYAAKHKAYQLLCAKQSGLMIPETCISNHYDAIKKISDGHHKLLSKMYTTYTWVNDDQTFGSFANFVEGVYDRDRLALELCPQIFQPAVEGGSEVRVVVYGEHIFALSMNPHSDMDDLADRRLAFRYQKTACKPISVPPSMIKKIDAYMRATNLKFGAFDFIIDRQGQWFFLECNEAGQFIYLEAMVPEFEILKTFSTWIAKFTKDTDGHSQDHDISLEQYKKSDAFSRLELQQETHKIFPQYKKFIEENCMQASSHATV